VTDVVGITEASLKSWRLKSFRLATRSRKGDGKSLKLNFDDWFYAIENHACIPFATAHVACRRIKALGLRTVQKAHH
jgi:hypothetical protein